VHANDIHMRGLDHSLHTIVFSKSACKPSICAVSVVGSRPQRRAGSDGGCLQRARRRRRRRRRTGRRREMRRERPAENRFSKSTKKNRSSAISAAFGFRRKTRNAALHLARNAAGRRRCGTSCRQHTRGATVPSTDRCLTPQQQKKLYRTSATEQKFRRIEHGPVG